MEPIIPKDGHQENGALAGFLLVEAKKANLTRQIDRKVYTNPLLILYYSLASISCA